MKNPPVSGSWNCALSVTLPPQARIAPVTSWTMPGRSAQDSVRTREATRYPFGP